MDRTTTETVDSWDWRLLSADWGINWWTKLVNRKETLLKWDQPITKKKGPFVSLCVRQQHQAHTRKLSSSHLLSMFGRRNSSSSSSTSYRHYMTEDEWPNALFLPPFSLSLSPLGRCLTARTHTHTHLEGGGRRKIATAAAAATAKIYCSRWHIYCSDCCCCCSRSTRRKRKRPSTYCM